MQEPATEVKWGMRLGSIGGGMRLGSIGGGMRLGNIGGGMRLGNTVRGWQHIHEEKSLDEGDADAEKKTLQ